MEDVQEVDVQLEELVVEILVSVEIKNNNLQFNKNKINNKLKMFKQIIKINNKKCN